MIESDLFLLKILGKIDFKVSISLFSILSGLILKKGETEITPITFRDSIFFLSYEI